MGNASFKVNYNKYSDTEGVPNRRRKEHKILRHFWKILAAVVVVLIGVRMATMETKLDLVKTYKVPDFLKLSELAELGYGQWAVAVDGTVAKSSGTDEAQPTASTTKMILALAVMEKKPFKEDEESEIITISQEYYDKYAWYYNNNGSNTQVEVGEEISEYDALVSMLLASSNNMADTLADWAFGSQEEYANYAKEMLGRMGITSVTIGPDASGYDDGTTATAEDLSKIAYYVLKQPVLAKIVGMKNATVPVAGEVNNTNKLLGKDGIVGVKTGYIGDASGYCLVSGYLLDDHIITIALMGAPTREQSFNDSLEIVEKLQDELVLTSLVDEKDEVGYYESWWSGKVPIKSGEKVSGLAWDGAEVTTDILVNTFNIRIGENQEYKVELDIPDFKRSPNLFDRFLHVFGWKKS